MNIQQHRITAAILLLTVLSTFFATPASGFTSSGSSTLNVRADDPIRLAYRNYDDIIIETTSTAKAASSSSTPKVVANESKKSVAPPKFHDDATFTTLDVDADRMPLSILLEPPAAPLSVKDHTNTTLSRTSARVTTTASRVAIRSTPITQLFNIQDYHRHVIDEPDQLCIIRFHAPWCQVCRTTNVSWERMASKIVKMNSSKRNIKFFSVNLDGKDEEVNELKDLLQIESVPQGVIHYARGGIFVQKVHLNRKNLGNLKKQLESYLTNEMGADMFLYKLKKEM